MSDTRNKRGQFVKGGKYEWRNAMLLTPLDKKLYVIWGSMIQRCNDKNHHSYSRYGGRGILVQDSWLKFNAFSKDMKNSYKQGLTIERIDNESNYSKSNCCWATKKEQANNRRSNRIIEFNGNSKTLAQWSEELGIKRTTISQRLDYYGWSISKALTT